MQCVYLPDLKDYFESGILCLSSLLIFLVYLLVKCITLCCAITIGL